MRRMDDDARLREFYNPAGDTPGRLTVYMMWKQRGCEECAGRSTAVNHAAVALLLRAVDAMERHVGGGATDADDAGGKGDMDAWFAAAQATALARCGWRKRRAAVVAAAEELLG
jgi:hypothetical protein